MSVETKPLNSVGNNNSSNMRSVEYHGGTIPYEVIGEINTSKHNPIVVIPGFARGKVGYRGLGKGLSEQGDRGVVVLDQPQWSRSEVLKFGKFGGLAAVDHQAESLLAVMKACNLEARPVDFVAHSFGAVILEKAAQLAHERGLDMTPFDSEKGSHSIFIGPAGTIEGDSLKKIKARFKKNIEQSGTNKRRGNDEYREINDEGAFYSKKTPKMIREAFALGKAGISYKELGRHGLKPFILGFPKDVVSSHELMVPTISQNSDYISGYAMPVSPEGTHDEVVFAPETTVKSVLNILDYN